MLRIFTTRKVPEQYSLVSKNLRKTFGKMGHKINLVYFSKVSLTYWNCVMTSLHSEHFRQSMNALQNSRNSLVNKAPIFVQFSPCAKHVLYGFKPGCSGPGVLIESGFGFKNEIGSGFKNLNESGNLEKAAYLRRNLIFFINVSHLFRLRDFSSKKPVLSYHLI